MASSASMLKLQYAGKSLEIECPAGTTIGQLKQQLQAEAHLVVDQQILAGWRSPPPSDTATVEAHAPLNGSVQLCSAATCPQLLTEGFDDVTLMFERIRAMDEANKAKAALGSLQAEMQRYVPPAAAQAKQRRLRGRDGR